MNPSLKTELMNLWALLPHPPDTYVRWFAKDKKERWGGGVTSRDELYNAAFHAAGKDFYVAPNPATINWGVRHSTEHVSHWSFFLIDIDPVKPNASPLEAAKCINLQVESELRLARPNVIDSGRGYQLWYNLTDGDFKSSILRRNARLSSAYWINRIADKVGEVAGCRIDTSCSDLPRLMRCPGTVNQKTGRLTSLVQFSISAYDARAIIAATPLDVFKEHDNDGLVPDGTPWQHVLHLLTPKAEKYLSRGWVEPGRHGVAWHTAKCLLEKGISPEEALLALQWANRLQGLEQELSQKDLQHAVNTAVKALDKTDEMCYNYVQPMEEKTDGASSV